MKIGIDARIFGLSQTGLGRYAQELVANLLKIDQKNDYLLFLRQGEKNKLTKEQRTQLTVREADIPHYSFREQVCLPSFLSSCHPDLVHFLHFNVPLFYHRPYVVTIHDLIKHESKGLGTTTRNPLVYWLKYLVYLVVIFFAVKKAKKVVVPSQWVKKKVVDRLGVDPTKVKVVYEGVSKEFLSRRKTDEVIKKHKIRKPFFLYVGSVYPHKNIEIVIKTMKEINNSSGSGKQPVVNLVIVCARNVFWRRLKKRIEKMKAENFVHLTGFVSEQDLAVFYQQAKGFVFPSLSEGFGLPGLEAMASGCPVACSDIPVFREVYGEVPFYFNPLKTKDVKEKLLTLLRLNKADRRKRTRKGIKHVKGFSWKKCAQETLKIYQEVQGL